jgi:hypothetical protein
MLVFGYRIASGALAEAQFDASNSHFSPLFPFGSQATSRILIRLSR